MATLKKILNSPDAASRTVFYGENISFEANRRVLESISNLMNKDREKEIILVVSSTGGDPYAGFAFYDLVKLLKPNLVTVAAGKCMSSALYVLISAGRGKRFATRHTKFLVHSSFITYKDYAMTPHDYARESNSSMMTQDMFVELLTKETSMKEKTLRAFRRVEPDMSVEDAVKNGIVSDIIE